jgi:acyl-CoA reductase-like NAD-dependent aldehyde dehydrogenase
LIASTLPETLCRVIQGGPDRASELLTLAWGHIFFTGSSRVGRLVMQAAAATLSPVTLELGGKNPCIVLADADPRITAERIAWGKFLNAGQTCAAPDTCFVARPIFPKFLAALRTAIRTFYGPDPRQSPDYSRIAHPAHFDRLRAFVGKGTLLQGGDSDRASLYFAPTLLQPDPDADPTVLQEEIFGPILPLLPFDDLAEVRSRLEAWPVPLAAYIFSSQRRRALRVLNTLRCATAAINDTVLQIANPRLDFGGLGQSGFGAYRGHASFATFSHFQARWIKPQRPHLRLRFPPFRITLAWLKRFYDWLGG